MDSIINVLTDPSEWFKAIFFWLVIVAIQKTYQGLPAGIKSVTRRNRFSRMKRIRSERKSDFYVYNAISRAQANYTLFMILAFGYLFGILFTPMKDVINTSVVLGAVVGLPVLGFEVAWLLNDNYAKELIKARHRLIRLRQ